MRLDVALVEWGLVRSRTRARGLIVDGRVSVDGRLVTKPSHEVGPGDVLDVTDDPWVSRGAHKLLGALEQSGAHVPARVLDAGASTGGFTQVLLSRGAEMVYAVDVGHGQLAPELRVDPRVRNLEGTHLRDLTLGVLDGEPVPFAVADVSFISLTQVLPPIVAVLAPDGQALVLVKPQFEVGRHDLGSGGVVRSDALRRRAVDGVIGGAEALGLRVLWEGRSVLPGPNGNVEFFLHLSMGSAKGVGGAQ